MIIKIILNEPYPHGLATTNRIHYYARGLTELGDQVEIILPRAKQAIGDPPVNTITKGIQDGVPFVYTPGRSVRTSSPILNVLFDIKGLILACARLLRNGKKSDAFLIVSSRFMHIIPVWCVSRLTGTKLLLEKSEVPFKNRQESKRTRLYTKYMFRLFDAIIIISDYLEDYFQDKIRKNARLLKIPILVNPNDFPEQNSIYSSVETQDIVYTGTLDQYKDGVMTLLHAFKYFIKKQPDARLIAIGKPGSTSDRKRIAEFIRENQLEGKVVITGYIERKEMLNFIQTARVLALAKPENKQSKACFPTKLGEYLLTGRPIVVTQTGEISHYLKNEIHAILVPSDDAIAFATGLEKAFHNSVKVQEMGLAGRELAIKEFSYIKNVEKIKSLIQEFKYKRS